MRIDQIMINTMLGAREVGLYSAALRLSEVWYFFPMIISNSLFPALVNAKEKNVELYNSRLKYLYAGMTWVSIIIAVIMTVISPWLIDFLFGTEYVDAIPVLRIHIWSGIFVFIGVAGSKWLVNEGLQKYFSIFTAVGAVVNFILNYFFIPKFGIAGAAIATLVAQFFASYALHILFDKTRPNFWRMTTSFLVVFTEVFAFLKRKS